MNEKYIQIFNLITEKYPQLNTSKEIANFWSEFLLNIILQIKENSKCLFCKQNINNLKDLIIELMNNVISDFSNENKNKNDINDISLTKLYNDINKFLYSLKTDEGKPLFQYIPFNLYNIILINQIMSLNKIEKKYKEYKYEDVYTFTNDFFYLFFDQFSKYNLL